MFCTVSNKHTDTKITRIKQKYSNDNQKARRKIIELQPQIFIYSFQVKLNKTTYLSFKHIICRFMTESDNVTDNLVFAVNSFLLASKMAANMREATCAAPLTSKHRIRLVFCDQRFRQKWDFCYNPYSVV